MTFGVLAIVPSHHKFCKSYLVVFNFKFNIIPVKVFNTFMCLSFWNQTLSHVQKQKYCSRLGAMAREYLPDTHISVPHVDSHTLDPVGMRPH
jgi:hypothetical protein